MPTQPLSKTHKNKCWWMNLSSMLTGDLLGARNTQFNTNFIHKEPHQNIPFFHLNIFGRFCLFLSWLFNPFNSFLDIISTLMKIQFSHRKISYRHRQRFLQNKLHEHMKRWIISLHANILGYWIVNTLCILYFHANKVSFEVPVPL